MLKEVNRAGGAQSIQKRAVTRHQPFFLVKEFGRAVEIQLKKGKSKVRK